MRLDPTLACSSTISALHRLAISSGARSAKSRNLVPQKLAILSVEGFKLS